MPIDRCRLKCESAAASYTGADQCGHQTAAFSIMRHAPLIVTCVLQAGRAGGGELRDGLCGARRQVQGARQRPGHAGGAAAPSCVRSATEFMTRQEMWRDIELMEMWQQGTDSCSCSEVTAVTTATSHANDEESEVFWRRLRRRRRSRWWRSRTWTRRCWSASGRSSCRRRTCSPSPRTSGELAPHLPGHCASLPTHQAAPRSAPAQL
jgi:hypothetical protein